MIKKILGAMFVVVFAGVPFFVMANPCVPGDPDYLGVACDSPPSTCTPSDYAADTCANSGGGTGGSNSTNQTTGGTLGGNSTNPTTGGTLGGTSLSGNIKIQNPIKYSTFSAFAAAVTKTAVQVLMPFIVLAFIYSGFLFVKAQGNDTGLTEAKKVLWYSMIGAFILLGAWGFAQIIGQTVSTITQ